MTTYLSDFGNIARSPFGALLYNAGCIMTGAAVVAFYFGLGDWESNTNPLLGVGRILGVASGIALAMIGLYSEDFPSQHRFWSYAFFSINFFAILFVNASLIGKEEYSKPTAFFGLGLTVSTVLSFLIWGGSPAVEWFTVFASMTFALLIGYDTHRTRQQGISKVI